MTQANWYSVGIDLSQIPWQIATVDAGGVESLADGEPHGATSSEAASEDGDVEGVVTAVRKIAVQRGAMPASIALHAGAGRGTDSLAGEVARCLGMDASVVQLHAADAADGTAKGLVLPSALALGAAWSAAAIGHVSAAGPAAAAGPAGVSLGAGGAGPLGVSLGSGAAGPAGVSMGASGAVGSAGVPLGAAPVIGPVGVSIGGGQGAGPIGQPLSGAVGGAGGLAGKLLRLPVVVAAAAALVVASAVVVVASRDDSPAATPSPLVTEPGTVGTTVKASTTFVATTATPTTVSAAPTVSAAACAVGSWLADNDAYLAAMQAAAYVASVTWDSVAGALRLDIAEDGAVVTTYEEWTFTSSMGSAGTAISLVSGVDKNTVTFADDGSYVVTATEIGSQTKVSSGEFTVLDGPTNEAFLRGSATYTCEGDQLEILQHFASDDWSADVVMVFARSG